MLLLEHDAKDFMATADLPVVPGCLVSSARDIVDASLPPGPWIVKAQVPTGGRGKAGGIRRANSRADLEQTVKALLQTTIRGHPVRECRIEQEVRADREAYLSFSINPEAAGIQILMSAIGGVEIESLHEHDKVVVSKTASSLAHAREVAWELASRQPENCRQQLSDAASRLVELFFSHEATLLEINPLFLFDDRPDWIAGDAKIILDENAFVRRPLLREFVLRRSAAYPETALKLTAGFDYVDIHRDGKVGMVTTGAGLSMMLIDELASRGIKALNFCDMRTGQMRGDPRRLIDILSRIRTGPNVRILLVNVFAGITDLGEFARLLVKALEALPDLRIPIVARLTGNNFEEGRRELARIDYPITLEPDLDAALALVTAECGR